MADAKKQGQGTRVEWWCSLDNGFVAEPELTELTFATRVTGHQATVHLPSVPSPVRAPAQLGPPTTGSTTSGEPSEEWGEVHHTKSGKASSVVVSRLVLTAVLAGNDMGVENSALSICEDMARWRQDLQTWLEVVTGQHLTTVGHRRTEYIGYESPIWRISEDRKMKPYSFPATIDIAQGFVRGVTPEILDKCLQLAADGPPPLAWVLLRDARSLADVRQYRRAVIDAATAAELAVTAMLDVRLASTEAKVREALVEAHRMLGRKMDLLKSLGNPLPPRFEPELVKPRNRAVHDARPVNEGGCRSAINMAASVVETAIPLPTPLRRYW